MLNITTKKNQMVQQEVLMTIVLSCIIQQLEVSQLMEISLLLLVKVIIIQFHVQVASIIQTVCRTQIFRAWKIIMA